eukprot:Opistho-1_new@63147
MSGTMSGSSPLVIQVRLLPSQVELATVGLQAASTAFAWPFMVSRELMQIGYEPVKPRKATDIFGKTVYRLPSGVGYARHIHGKVGWRGLFRGFATRALEGLVNTLVRNLVKRAIYKAVGWDTPSTVTPGIPTPVQLQIAYPHVPQPDGLTFSGCAKELVVEVISGCVAQLVSHPLRGECYLFLRVFAFLSPIRLHVCVVVSCRMAAQYIGGERIYTGVFQSLRLIYVREGFVEGLYVGIVPALLGEVIETAVTTGLRQLSIAFFDEDDEDEDEESESDDEAGEDELDRASSKQAAIAQERGLAVQIGQVLLSPLFYPFLLIKTRMIVANAGLVASQAPFFMGGIHASWVDYWAEAHARGGWSSEGLLRGSTMFGRTIPAKYLKESEL